MSEEQPPAAEPIQEQPVSIAKPEAPAGTLREQILALVPDESKSQVADLLRSLIEHSPASAPEKKEEPQTSKSVEFRHKRLPFRSPLITKEEPKREGANYGSISDD